MKSETEILRYGNRSKIIKMVRNTATVKNLKQLPAGSGN